MSTKVKLPDGYITVSVRVAGGRRMRVLIEGFPGAPLFPAIEGNPQPNEIFHGNFIHQGGGVIYVTSSHQLGDFSWVENYYNIVQEMGQTFRLKTEEYGHEHQCIIDFITS